jgi:hypothetical protein
LVIEVEPGKVGDGCRIDLPIRQVSDCWVHAIEEQLSQE